MKKILLTLLLISIGIITYQSLFNENSPPYEEPIKVKNKKNKKLIKPHDNIPIILLEKTMPPKEFLNDLTAYLIGLADEKDPLKRTSKVWNLEKVGLTEYDFRALVTFLNQKPQQEGSNLSLHSLKNDILVFLIKDGRYKESTGELLVELVEDPSQNEVMREYALQYYFDYFERHWLDKRGKDTIERTNLSEQGSLLQNRMLTTLWDMTRELNGPIAGTSLIQLHQISLKFSVLNSKLIDSTVENMILNESMPASSRMAALSIADEREMDHLKSISNNIAFDSDYPVSLRMAALHTSSKFSLNHEFWDKLDSDILNNADIDKRLQRTASLLNKFKNKRIK